LPEGGGSGVTSSSGGCMGSVCNGTCEVDSDPLNCGACGHDCFGGACEAGRCQPVVLATDELGVWAIAVDETHVYRGYSSEEPAIKRARIDGGDKETLSTTKHASTFMMLVDATHLYWTYRSDTHRVMRMPKAGGAETVLADGAYPTGIAVDVEYVYWANYFLGEVRKVPLAGGTASTISDNEPGAAYITTGGGRVIWTNEHWEDHVGKVRAWSASGTQTLASKQGRPHFVTTDGVYAYWTAPTDGTVMRALLEGGAGAETLASGEEGAGGIMRDGELLYWQADNSIRSMPSAGGEVTTIYEYGDVGANVVQDSTSFYWCEVKTGMIRRLAKPVSPTGTP
jgi:hypothetical protein